MRIKCKLNISFDHKLFNEAQSEMMSLRSVVDMISNLETSDLDSKSGNESSEEDNDDNNNGDDIDVEEKNTSVQCGKCLLKKAASDTKIKASEAGYSSEQNKTLPEKPENTLSSTVNNLSNNQSTHLEFWESTLNDSPESSEFDDEENDQNGEDLVDGEIDYDSDTIDEVSKYHFLSNRKENEMSKLLKVKINLLPLPAMLKVFLNYSKDD